MIRKILELHNVSLDTQIGDKPLSDLVLAPTKIYVRAVLELMQQIPVHALAHITGGGIPGNLVRVLPEDCHAVVNESSWQWPELFTWMMNTANVERDEMYRTFNCGIGMTLVIPKKHCEQAINILNEAGETAILIGEIRQGAAENPVQIL